MPTDFLLQELSNFDYKDKETCRDERKKHCKSLYCDRFLTIKGWLVVHTPPLSIHTQLIVKNMTLPFC